MALRRWERRKESGGGRGEGMVVVGGGIRRRSKELEVAEEAVGPFAGGAGDFEGCTGDFGGFCRSSIENWRGNYSRSGNAEVSHGLH